MHDEYDILELEDLEDMEFEDSGEFDEWEIAQYEQGGRPSRTPGSSTVNMPPHHIVVIRPGQNRFVLREFAVNSSRVPSQHRPTVSAIAQHIISRHGTPQQIKRVRFIGHTDERGSVDNNLNLGLRRAREVRKFLESVIRAGTVLRSGFTMPAWMEGSGGEGQPDSTTAARNRRVEILIE